MLLATAGLSLGSCRPDEKQVPPGPAARNLPGTHRAIADSVVAAGAIAAETGLLPPFRIVELARYKDGGSVGASIVDVAGDTLEFFLATGRYARPPGILYVGGRSPDDAGARAVPPGSLVEQAVGAAMLLYGHGDPLVRSVAAELMGDCEDTGPIGTAIGR